ncbi:MAG TPA: thrombospondin type 3 repeat-containing protein [Polyangia bacterium]|nr:thrombospondin type 3 repeat-containing protein [Polyangia bacterium]
MTSPIRPRARLAATFLPLLTTLVFSAGAARAQNVAPRDTSIDPQLFQPAIGPQNFLTVEGAQVPDHKRFSLGLELNYQQRPYTVFTQGQSPGKTYIIDNQLSGELDAAIGLFNRYQFGIGIPFTPYLDGDVVDDMGMPAHLHLKESGIGDIRLEGKAHLATLGPDDQYDVAISAGLTLPTGHWKDLDWLGDKTVTGRIRAIATADLGPVTVGANLGILIRATSHSFATELGPQLLYGAAANFAVNAKTGIILEAAGRSGLNQFASRYSDVNPFEIDLAGRRALTGMWSLTGGVGRGLGSGIGAPDFRGFLMAAFNPDFRDRDHDGVYDINDKCPDQPEDRDGFQDSDGCPDPDNDADGIPDASDKCPNEAEDVDDFQDADGCPDPDNDKDGIPDLNDACPNAPEDHKGKHPNDGCPSNVEDSDGDGVPDAVDKCPDEPEDKDGFEDADGCPDPDNDGDGIPDNFDNCPNAPEDADGFQDEDGCPDPDNDKDGIPDASDKCPLQPETLNGIKDEDGCPDPGPEIVRLGQGRIEVDEKIGFGVHGGKLLVREPSAKVVNDVALVMKGHPEIAKLRIEVTADGVPKSDTQRRADALRDYLVAKGVDAGRIEAVGAGAGGSRIEFIVAATGPETPAAAPAKAAQPAPAAPPAPAARPSASPAPATPPRPPKLPAAPAPSPAPPVPPGAPVPGSH